MNIKDIEIGHWMRIDSSGRYAHVQDITLDSVIYDIYEDTGELTIKCHSLRLDSVRPHIFTQVEVSDLPFLPNPNIPSRATTPSGPILNAPLDEAEMNRRRHEAMKKLWV